MAALPSIVLVHGAWADGSCWSDVIARLHADGFKVTAPQPPESSLAANVAAIGPALGEQMGHEFSWLFGRRSYEDMLGHWNEVGGPFKDGLNQTVKYIASSNPDTDLPWAKLQATDRRRTSCGR